MILFVRVFKFLTCQPLQFPHFLIASALAFSALKQVIFFYLNGGWWVRLLLCLLFCFAFSNLYSLRKIDLVGFYSCYTFNAFGNAYQLIENFLIGNCSF